MDVNAPSCRFAFLPHVQHNEVTGNSFNCQVFSAELEIGRLTRGDLDGYFSDIDAEAADKFGERVIIQSRALRADHAHELPPNESPVCLNCGTRLRGQYCGICGQRSRSRLISIWQLLKEAFGDLLELDSRLWKTLLPLLIRPGQLTRDYLEG